MFNRELVAELRKDRKHAIFLPQELSVSDSPSDKELDDLFHTLIEEIDKSDLIIAILDGSDVDSGTCVEIGYAYAKGKPILGLRTDFRNSESEGLNLMVLKTCKKYLWPKDNNIEEISRKILLAIDNIS